MNAPLTTDRTICQEPKLGARILCEIPDGGFTVPGDTMRLYEIRRGDFVRVTSAGDVERRWIPMDFYRKNQSKFKLVRSEEDSDMMDRASWLTMESDGFIAVHRTWSDVEWFILEGMRARIEEVETY